MKRRIIALAVAFVGLLLFAALLPLGRWAALAADMLRSSGLAGAGCFVGVYAVLSVLLVPRSVLNLLGGLVYGTILGTGLAAAASMLGAWLAFVLGRSLLSDLLRRAESRSRRWRATDAVVRAHPILFTTLWHLSLFLPFSAINYYMGAARVPLSSFLVGKATGVLPATFAYVYMGTLIPDVLMLASGDLPDGARATRLAVSVAGVAVTFVFLAWVGRAARRALRALEEET